MISEERVILMTRLQSYEDNEGKHNVAIANYFRSDYLGRQILRSIICATLVTMMLFAGYILYDFENFMKNIYQIDLIAFARHALIVYLVFVGIFAVITYIVYAYRYTKAKKSLRQYFNNLKKLNQMYNKE